MEFESRPEVLAFLRGGSWRGFFRKYAESNLLHKKMLRASARVAAAFAGRIGDQVPPELLQARDLILRAQCNDAYWHGIFGGLYAPHLRTDLWRNLVRAESIADRLTPGLAEARVEFPDYDADGANEFVFSAPEYQAVLKPADGATLATLDFRPAAATLINSILRRPEAYHARLREAAQPAAAGVASIHEQTRTKEPGLERFLRYDRWPRHAFRVLLFDAARTQADYETLQLNEEAAFAGGEYRVRASGTRDAELAREDAITLGGKDDAFAFPMLVTKRFSFAPVPGGCDITCELAIRLKESLSKPMAVGLESVINFLAPSEPDRFFQTPTGPQNLRFSGVLPAPRLLIEDGWQRVRVTLNAPGAQEFWVAPIETVSESEEGFERVYQGSQILALWRPDLTKLKSWTVRLVWRVEGF
jgi:alpha-amylase